MSKEVKKELRELQERMDNWEAQQTVETWRYGPMNMKTLAKVVEDLEKHLWEKQQMNQNIHYKQFYKFYEKAYKRACYDNCSTAMLLAATLITIIAVFVI